MKSLIASITILGLVGMVVGVAVQGATEASVAATVTVQSISVAVSDGTVAYGTLAAGASENTVDLTDTQTATNDGNVTEDFLIRGRNTTAWTLGATAGTDVYAHEFSLDSFATAGTALTTSNQALTAGIAGSGSDTFDLKVTTPTSSSNFTEQDVSVTVVATAS